MGLMLSVLSQNVWPRARQPALTHGPVVVHVLCDVRGRVVGGEEELFCLSTHQDEAQINLQVDMDTLDKSQLENSVTVHLRQTLSCCQCHLVFSVKFLIVI